MKLSLCLFFILAVLQTLATSATPSHISSFEWRDEARKEKPYIIEIAYGEILPHQKKEVANFDLRKFQNFDRLTFSTSSSETNEIAHEDIRVLAKFTELHEGFSIRINITVRTARGRVDFLTGAFTRKGEWTILGTSHGHKEKMNSPELDQEDSTPKILVALRVIPNS